jgi:hypothetical protein
MLRSNWHKYFYAWKNVSKLAEKLLNTLCAESFSIQMTACWCDAFVDAGSISPVAGQTSYVENFRKIICKTVYLSHFYAFWKENS